MSNNHNTTILVVREENLWQDWTSANHWLGQDNVAAFPKFATRNFSHMDLPVTKALSDKGAQRLCSALQAEYESYLHVLSRAVNLHASEVQQSLELARRNYPPPEPFPFSGEN